MIKLKANFEADWVAHLKRQLTAAWGSSAVECLDDQDIRYCYFETLHRRLPLVSRRLQISSEFRCPPEAQSGWQVLQEKISDGKDLNPHLSTRHASPSFNDGLLAEWGVHHFHLGIEPDGKDQRYVARTRLLVFAMITVEAFYAINTFAHDGWEDESIVEIIHQNWPEVIARYRMKGVTAEKWNPEQRRGFRSKNANVLVSTKDGTVYLIGGVTASGVKTESVIRADHWHAEVNSLQGRLENQMDDLVPLLEQHGYGGESEVEATLHISETGYQALFPKYGISASLNLTK